MATNALYVFPFLVGAAVCAAGGLWFALWIVVYFTDKIIDRLVRQFNLYDAVLATGKQRIQARRKRRAEKTS